MVSSLAELDQAADRSVVVGLLEADINRAARIDGHVLITGDADAGQSVVARIIHQRSRRAAARMAILSCAGLPDQLLESELFGHLRASFAGAYCDKSGVLDLAAGGTLCLNDVGEMSARVQSALLRFLETGAVTRVGADRPQIHVDVRIIAAVTRDLHEKIRTGAFNRRLFDRLNRVSFVVPPLRDRLQDMPFLLDALLHAHDGADKTREWRVSRAAMRLLAAYAWPGNVRELEHVVDRLALRGRGRGRVVKSADLPAAINDKPAQRELARATRVESLVAQSCRTTLKSEL